MMVSGHLRRLEEPQAALKILPLNLLIMALAGLDHMVPMVALGMALTATALVLLPRV